MKTNIKVYLITCCSFILMLLTPQERCFAQYLAGYREIPHRDIDNLVKTLESGMLTEVPEVFFGDLFDPNLVDLVVFVDENKDTAKIRLIKNGECKPYLYGARYFWVMVFWKIEGKEKFDKTFKTRQDTTRVSIVSVHSDSLSASKDTLRYITIKNPTPEGAKKTVRKDTVLVYDDKIMLRYAIEERSKSPDTLKVRLERLNRRIGTGEKIVTMVARVISGVMGVSLEDTASQDTLADMNTGFTLKRLTADSSGTYLYYGIIKLPLEENTINRVSVKSIGNKSAYSTFGNYSSSRIGAGICAAFNFKDDVRANEDNFTMRNLEVEPFLLAHIYLLRPKLPKIKVPGYVCDEGFCCRLLAPLRPLSITTGFKIESENLFDDIYFGMSRDYLFGPVGFTIGVNFRSKTTDERKQYKPEVMWGLSLTL